MVGLTEVNAVIDAANATETVNRMMRGWDRTIALNIGVSPFWIRVSAGKATLLESAPAKTDISFTLKQETLALLMSQEITPLGAKLKGLVQSSGNVMDILRFSSILSSSIKEIKGSLEKA